MEPDKYLDFETDTGIDNAELKKGSIYFVTVILCADVVNTNLGLTPVLKSSLSAYNVTAFTVSIC